MYSARRVIGTATVEKCKGVMSAGVPLINILYAYCVCVLSSRVAMYGTFHRNAKLFTVKLYSGVPFKNDFGLTSGDCWATSCHGCSTQWGDFCCSGVGRVPRSQTEGR